MAEPNKNAILNKLRMLAVSIAAGHALGVPAQESKEQHAPENQTTVLNTPENRELNISEAEIDAQASEAVTAKTYTNKVESFEKLEELPYGLFEQKAQYVMSCNDWNKNKNISIKRVDKDQIYNYDLASVMEAREGAKGDIINKNASGSRMFIFQSTPAMGKNFIRYLYCSNNEDLHNFAAEFVVNDEKTKIAAEKARKSLYDEDGEMKTGQTGHLSRQSAVRDMAGITTKSIGDSRYSARFISRFRELAKNCYEDVFTAEKEFAAAIYPLIGTRTNQIINGTENLAKQAGKRDASCLNVGKAGQVLASKIACGAGSPKIISEPVITRAVSKISKCDYLTLDAVRLMAVAGIKGADEMYKNMQQKTNEYKSKMAEKVKEITTPDLTNKPDAIKNHREEILMQKQAESHPKNRVLDLGKLIQQKQQHGR